MVERRADVAYRACNRISAIACLLPFKRILRPGDAVALKSKPLYIAPMFEGVNNDAAAKGGHELHGFL